MNNILFKMFALPVVKILLLKEMDLSPHILPGKLFSVKIHSVPPFTNCSVEEW